MTPEQIQFAQALSRVTFMPGTPTKRFAKDMAHCAEHQPERELTPKQAEYLRTAVIRFRRQIDAGVVDIARGQGA